MTYSDFYDITVYGNDNWKGNFTEKEVAEMAYEYTVAFEESKASEDADATIVSLIERLGEDNCEEAKEWLRMIAEELGIIDMDAQDYVDTDAWLEQIL